MPKFQDPDHDVKRMAVFGLMNGHRALLESHRVAAFSDIISHASTVTLSNNLCKKPYNQVKKAIRASADYNERRARMQAGGAVPAPVEGAVVAPVIVQPVVNAAPPIVVAPLAVAAPVLPWFDIYHASIQPDEQSINSCPRHTFHTDHAMIWITSCPTCLAPIVFVEI